MTAELVHGQNHALMQTRLEIRITADKPVVAGATLSDEQGKVRGTDWVAHPGTPQLPGLEVPKQAAAEHRLAVDLGALPPDVHRVNVLLALPTGVGGPEHFGALAAPFTAITGIDGTEIATFTVTGLDTESAVVPLELYRRQGAWKVRALGQGYAGGLAAMLADQGLPQAAELAGVINDAVAQGVSRSVAAAPPRSAGSRHRTAAGGVPPGAEPAAARDGAPLPGATADGVPTQSRQEGAGGVNYQHPRRKPAAEPAGPGVGGSVDYQHAQRASTPPGGTPAAPPAAGAPYAGDASGWTMDERLYNQIWGMFEDLARTVAAYRSAVDFADSRMERELDGVLSDPRTRFGPQADAARSEAQAKRTGLIEQARAVLDRDLAQLSAEAEVVEPALPPAFAAWDNPCWHAYQVPIEIPMAMRLGDLSLPESTGLRVPLLVRLPLERGLWIDSGTREAGGIADADERKALAIETAVAHASRLLATYPAGEFTLHIIDPAGGAGHALTPLLHSGVLAEPPASGTAGVQATLSKLTQRVDLVQMAVRSGAVDSLPPDLDTAEQLLIVHDFPHGFDDRAITQLRYLADEGPAVGVHLMLVADREDSQEYGPVLDPMWRSLLRVTPVADDHLADPWIGHAWTYDPPRVPPGSQVLTQVLAQVAVARRAIRP